ncbi:MAG: primosomal protein N' [Nitrospiraceae bacterium]|nr:primosomal protein N' [Nitrospiraceae bacterium]
MAGSDSREIPFSCLYDLVFPSKLKPLTYKSAEGIEPGTVVLAELRKSLKRAVVLRTCKPNPREKIPGTIKEIREVVFKKPALTRPLLQLIEWMAGYYMANEGLALKAMYGGGLFEKGNPRKKREAMALPEREDVRIPPGLLEKLKEKKGFYRAHLLLAPDTAFERTFVKEAVRGEKGAVILCPEVSRISLYEAELRPVFGDRLVILHGNLSRAERNRALERIRTGESDIVLGSRIALFSPVEKVSLIVVTSEENPSYKNEEYVRYSARDVAVMRALYEGAGVLLTSICPSAESWMNALKGKYELLDGAGANGRRVRIVSERHALEEGKAIAAPIRKALSLAVKKGGHAALLVNRLGHSIPFCEECGHVERCLSCGLALVYHKEGRERKKILRCHYCGAEKPLPGACPRCGGHNIKLLGAGTERLKEEILKEMPGVSFAIETSQEKAEDDREAEQKKPKSLFIGTKTLANRPAASGEAGFFSAAAFINPEAALVQPEFRARERVFAEASYLADKLTPGGALYIQTREPALLSHMKGLNYREFMQFELSERKTAGYPPFSKLALVVIPLAVDKKEKPPEINLPAVEDGRLPDVQFLGPAARLGRKGKKALHILVKAPDARTLREAARELLKGIKAERVIVDIDPL